MFKLNQEVEVVNVDDTGLNEYDDYYIGRIGIVVHVNYDNEIDSLPVTVRFDSYEGHTYYFADSNLRGV